MNKLSLIKSINNVTHMKSINILSLVKTTKWAKSRYTVYSNYCVPAVNLLLAHPV